MHPTVRAATLMNFAEVARQTSAHPLALLRRLDLDPRVLENPDIRLPAVKVITLLELAAATTGCESFGLRMAERRRLSDFGALSLLLTHQPTLREILTTLGRYRTLLNETLTLHVEETDRLVIVREELLVSGPLGARQAHELAAGVLIRIFKALLGSRWQPISVNFTHAAPADCTVHHRILGQDLIFNSEFNGFICAAEDLDRSNPTADPVMADYARGFIDRLPLAGGEGIVGDVKRALHQLAPSGQSALGAVAARLGTPSRTLQRRLSEHGLDFRSLLDEVRAEIALQFLSNRAFTVTEVGQRLGFQQSSAFSRWFRNRFGVSPSQWRNAPEGRKGF